MFLPNSVISRLFLVIRRKSQDSEPKTNNQWGFTLIELLVALTILTILAVSVYASLNPAQRLRDSKDARRAADVGEILNAIHQSIVDNKGSFPSNLPTTEQQIGTGDATTCLAAVGTYCTGMTTGCVNLMVGGQNLTNYLASMPFDPNGGAVATAVKTGYSVKRDGTTGIVTVKACYTDGTTAVSASR